MLPAFTCGMSAVGSMKPIIAWPVSTPWIISFELLNGIISNSVAVFSLNNSLVTWKMPDVLA